MRSDLFYGLMAIVMVAVFSLVECSALAGPPPIIDDSMLMKPRLEIPEPGPAEGGVGTVPAPAGECSFDAAFTGSPAPYDYTAHPEPGIPHEVEAKLIERVMHRCNKSSAKNLDLYVALSLLRIEREEGLPLKYSGLLISVGCGEVAWSTDPNARGDGGKARGWTQTHADGPLHYWCGKPDLDDLEANARCWLRRVVVIANTKARRCKRDAWAAAEAWVAMGGKSEYLCVARSGHWERLEEWRKG